MTLHYREFDAMQEILQVLSHLDEDAQRRVTSWVSERIARAGSVVALTSPGEELVESLPIKGLGPTKPDALNESVLRTLRDLLDAGVIRPGEPIEWRRPEVGQHYMAAILHEGMIVTADGRTFSSLSTAASALAGISCNDWICWTVPRLGEVRIGSLRGRSRGPTLD